jgi:hypothetical protein
MPHISRQALEVLGLVDAASGLRSVTQVSAGVGCKSMAES